MVFVYFLIGVLVAIALHYFLKFFTYAEPETIRKTTRAMVVILVVVLIILFIRFGMMELAAITSFLGVVLPWVERAVRVKRFITPKQKTETPPPPAAPLAKMTRKEALEILGLKDGATRKEILDAYKKMIRKNHPDQGGSEYLAAKINQARDVLLDGMK